MKRIILKGPGFCAVTEDGILVEYMRTDEEQQCGDILLGKAERIMPSLECVFVDIGRKKPGFLPMKERSLTFAGEPVRSGSIIAVQIKKEETGSKGAYLTRDLTLAGKNIILMPMNRYIGVSGRITDEGEKEKLRSLGREIAEGKTGIVMRNASAAADPRDIWEEACELGNRWNETLRKIKETAAPGTVLCHQDPLKQMISDYEGTGILEMKEAGALPADLERQLRISENRTVPVANGGNIVIDRCEAMTVIDVNSGSAAGKAEKETTFLETNLAACAAAAAQIRLRNLSGIILIDFIDMETEANRAETEDKLRELFARDRRKTVVHGWTRLGLMEITRKRTGF